MLDRDHRTIREYCGDCIRATLVMERKRSRNFENIDLTLSFVVGITTADLLGRNSKYYLSITNFVCNVMH